MKKPVKVATIMGGRSSEKEISLESGRYMFQNLNPERFEAEAVFFTEKGEFFLMNTKNLVQNTTKDVENSLKPEQKISYEDLSSKFDIALLATHGRYGEDGCLQGLLEIIGLPYTGSGILASALGSNKLFQRKVFESEGIKFPDFISIRKEDLSEDLIKKVKSKIGFPCISKPANEGCSTGIFKINAEKELLSSLEETLQWGEVALLEKFIEGTEFTVPVLGNENPEALPITELPIPPEHTHLTLEDKFLPGGAEMITPARFSKDITKKIQDTALQVFLSLGLKGYARIDGFLTTEEEILITEPNTLPGATPSTCLYHSAAEVNLSPMDLIEKIIDFAFKAHAKKRGPL